MNHLVDPIRLSNTPSRPRRPRPRVLGALVVLSVLCQLPALAEVVIPVTNSAELTAAFGTVPEGGIIELAAGTYNPPGGGWDIAAVTKSYTIRGAAGATAILDGGGSDPILRFSFFDPGVSVVLQNLTFANGMSTLDGWAGGVTLFDATATFIDCTFLDNDSLAPTTGGGGVAAFVDSTAHFFGCTFDGNRAKNEGGGLKSGGGSAVYFHDSEFIANRTDVANHRLTAAGAGIHLANGELRISNSRFDSNVAGCLGGGIYALGGWDEPTTEVTVVNSTFVDNWVAPHPSVSCTFSADGGAIHGEANVGIELHNSRVLTNTAESGGAISLYQAQLGIYDSIFRGNQASGANPEGRGGAISASSLDLASDEVNRPPVSITIRDSLFQGRFDDVGATALKGGCIWLLGDTNRTYGRNGVPPMGDPEVNRAVLDVANTVFYDCDAVREEGAVGTGVGGAMQLAHVALTLDDSLVAGCDVTGTNASGGGIRLINESAATVTDSTFAENTAELRSGALDVAGSEIEVDNSQFFLNEAGLDGAAITTAILTNGIATFDFSATGEIKNSVFSGHPSLTLREFDADNPECEINSVVYNNNRFFTTPVDDDVYRNSLAGGFQTVGELNDFVVVRSNCDNTVKSTIDNVVLTGEPDLTALVGMPPEILPVAAAGDPATPTESFLGYAWNGSAGALDGVPLATQTGLEETATGMHTLVAGTSSSAVEITDGPNPAATFTATPACIPGGETADLVWSTTAGTFLGVAIDRTVEIPVPAAAGSVTVMPPATRRYNLCVLTEEGGVWGAAAVEVDDCPDEDPIFADGFESGNTSAWTVTIP